MNLFSAAERLAAMDRPKIYLDASRCLYSLDKFTDCSTCMTTCPVDAITRADAVPVLSEDTCVTCLACLPVCPTGAIHGDDSLKGLLNCASRLQSGGVELVCEHNTSTQPVSSETTTILRVHGCLAGFGPGALASLIAAEVTPVRLRIDACSSCHIGKVEAQIRQQVDAANQFLGQWGKSADVSTCSGPTIEVGEPVPVWDADNPPLSRRDLFRLGSRQGSLALARVLNTDSEPKKEKSPPRDRRRLVAAADHLPKELPLSGTLKLEGLQCAIITVSEECYACSVCARACPTGAIEFTRNELENSFQLSFHAKACTGCSACVHACAVGAISLQPDPSFDQVFVQEPPVLFEGSLRRCQRCNTWIPAQRESRLCPICEYRKKNPFGYTLPPGFQRGMLPPKKDGEA